MVVLVMFHSTSTVETIPDYDVTRHIQNEKEKEKCIMLAIVIESIDWLKQPQRFPGLKRILSLSHEPLIKMIKYTFQCIT